MKIKKKFYKEWEEETELNFPLYYVNRPENEDFWQGTTYGRLTETDLTEVQIRTSKNDFGNETEFSITVTTDLVGFDRYECWLEKENKSSKDEFDNALCDAKDWISEVK